MWGWIAFVVLAIVVVVVAWKIFMGIWDIFGR